MSLSMLLKQVQENGRVNISINPDRSPDALVQYELTLRELDALSRLELAFQPPRFSLRAASWAGMVFYQACQFLVYREIAADTVVKALAQSCPEPQSPSICYSVDLTFRYIPD